MDADVVIAGAGPNGLMLAAELRLAGVQPIVLERLPEHSDEPRANGLVGQVVRMLDRRGLFERLSGTAGPPRPQPGFVFGAMPLDLSVLEDNPMYLLPVPQRRIEEVLEERALELGAEVRRGHELLGFTHDADGVTVEIAGPDGAYELRTQYLVGADGGRSVVRKLAGIDFPGVSNDSMVSRTGSAAAAYVEDGLLRIPGYGVIRPFLHHRTERGLFVWAPFPDRLPAISTGEWDVPGDGPMTFAELQESVDRVLGVHLPLSEPEGDGPRLLRRVVGGNSRLASRFRDRRALLVGDAAHVHSAIGGPGLNLGLQDTVNLGWKLAGVLQGWAPDDLLDTYESERRPVGERVVMSTQAQSALIAPGNEVTALRSLFGEFLQDPANIQRLANLMSGADIHYFNGPHPLTGHWAPDLLVGEQRLAELLRTARPVLVDLLPGSPYAQSVTSERIDVAVGEGAFAMLVRPDGYVAWAASDAGDVDGLRDGLAKWFGVYERPLTSATR
ncbi:FAD-dependent monooxygenase [Kribbella sp. NPDC026611]|uniref:FAD-dependent monooxygenase n=1 Tax=Kribbella sp. NPDC026611 TaxID=3154911 RepID=UPI0033C80813